MIGADSVRVSCMPPIQRTKATYPDSLDAYGIPALKANPKKEGKNGLTSRRNRTLNHQRRSPDRAYFLVNLSNRFVKSVQVLV